MSFYQRMQGTSRRLINQFKQGAVAYNAPGTEGDPFNPPTAGTSYPVDAVQSSGNRKKQYVDAGYIVGTDILLAVSPFAVEPSQSGTLTINGEQHQIVMVDNPTIEPESPLVWFIGCRK